MPILPVITSRFPVLVKRVFSFFYIFLQDFYYVNKKHNKNLVRKGEEGGRRDG